MAELTISIDTLVDTHLAGYCEPDATRRLELLSEVWAADGELLDPPIAGTGPEGIAELVDIVLQHYPAHRFVRTSAVDAHHEYARYAWNLVAPDGTATVTGTDVVTLTPAGDRLQRVVGFFGDLAAAE